MNRRLMRIRIDGRGRSKLLVGLASVFAFLPASGLLWTLVVDEGRHRDLPVVALESLSSIETHIYAGEHNRYRISLVAGEFVAATVVQEGIDVAATVFDSVGHELLRVDSPTGTRGFEEIPILAKKSGDYYVDIQASEIGPEVGSYAIRLGKPRVATSLDGRRTEIAKSISYAQRLLATSEGKAFRNNRLRGLEILNRTLNYVQASGDLVVETKVLLELSKVDRTPQDRTKGILNESQITSMLQTILESQALADPMWKSIVLTGLGAQQQRMYDFSRAIQSYKNVLEIEDRLFGPCENPSVLRNLGSLFRHVPDMAQALDYLSQSLDCSRRTGNWYEEGLSLAQRGELRGALGQTELALRDLESALKVWRNRDNQEQILLTLATTVEILREDSGVFFRKAKDLLAELNPEEPGLLAATGAIYERLGSDATSLDAYSKALALFQERGDRLGVGRTLLRLGRVHLQRTETERAETAYAQALACFRAAEDVLGISTALLGLARSERELGRLPQSKEYIEEAVSMVESVRLEPRGHPLDTATFASKKEFYDFFIDLLMRLHTQKPGNGYDLKALEVSERARARNFLETLVRDASDRTGIGNRRFAPLTVPQIQRQLLEVDELLLEYWLGDSGSYLWVVSRDSVEAFSLPSKAVIDDSVKRAYELLTVSHHPDMSTRAGLALRALSRTVLQPAAASINSKRLLIVTDGSLDYIPFSVLPEPACRESSERSGAADCLPLILEHEMVRTPSASVAAFLRSRPALEKPVPVQGELAVFADPVDSLDDERLSSDLRKNGSGFQRLPFAHHEARMILALAPSNNTLAAFGFSANKERVLEGALRNYRILHFATHAVVDPHNPMRSGVVLSLVDEHGRPQDGVLRLGEIVDLNLRAELVVVSGCKTAIGREFRGEGLINLAKGFMYAGAQQVLVSLWDVEDVSTAELMTRFYQYLFRDHLSPSAALRKAQISMFLESKWAPYQWAAFVLEGA